MEATPLINPSLESANAFIPRPRCSTTFEALRLRMDKQDFQTLNLKTPSQIFQLCSYIRCNATDDCPDMDHTLNLPPFSIHLDSSGETVERVSLEANSAFLKVFRTISKLATRKSDRRAKILLHGLSPFGQRVFYKTSSPKPSANPY